jgi:hypothetical protein
VIMSTNNHRSSSSSSKRIVIPVTPTDRQRLMEIKTKMGSWTSVSEALGFRGASTARKWALSDSTTFKGKDYPERIKQLHERVVGKPVTMPKAVSDPRVERVETMMEVLLTALGIDPTTLTSPKVVAKKVREIREAQENASEVPNGNAGK